MSSPSTFTPQLSFPSCPSCETTPRPSSGPSWTSREPTTLLVLSASK
jgi:hypothetical protein